MSKRKEPTSTHRPARVDQPAADASTVNKPPHNHSYEEGPPGRQPGAANDGVRLDQPAHGHREPEATGAPLAVSAAGGLTWDRDALRSGELTVIDLVHDTAAERTAWAAAVGSLITAALEVGTPVVYVTCGGADGAPTSPTLGDPACNHPLLRRCADDDVIVWGPGALSAAGAAADEVRRRGAAKPAYACHVPTLLNVRATIADQEAVFGDALVMLDRVENMRPYRSVAESSAVSPRPGGRELSDSDAYLWLAADLRAASGDRSGPTVAVTSSADAAAALRTVAHLYITISQDAHHRPYATVEMRDEPGAPWKFYRVAFATAPHSLEGA